MLPAVSLFARSRPPIVALPLLGGLGSRELSWLAAHVNKLLPARGLSRSRFGAAAACCVQQPSEGSRVSLIEANEEGGSRAKANQTAGYELRRNRSGGKMSVVRVE